MKKRQPEILFVISILICTAVSLSPDGLSLLAFKSAADPSPAFYDWNDNDTTPCAWSGVTCANVSGFSDPRVVALSFSSANVSAYLPSELGSLVYLRRLNLHNNRLFGPIPASLANASALHSLVLSCNNLSGPVPPELCYLPRLQNLDLSANSLSGPISSDLARCLHLQRLSLGRNALSGDVPAGIWSGFSDLVQLDLSSNNLTGSIPPDLGQLRSLSGTLNLSFNHFSGKIPASLGDLPLTVSFDLRYNDLSGEIPESGSFANQGPTAFLGNAALCGFPLKKPCRIPSKSSPAADGSSPGSSGVDGGRDNKDLSPGMIVLISAADAAGVAVLGLVVVYICWKRKDSGHGCSCAGKGKLGRGGGRGIGRMCQCWRSGLPTSLAGVDSEKGGSGSMSGGGGEGELVAIDKEFRFELEELLRASAYVLGKSRLGIVYKVVLGNGVPVAVRRLGEGGGQRYREFVAEVQAIGRVRHPNIVRLRAYYWAPDEKLLVSDFISNGNLAGALKGRPGQAATNLTWAFRLKIAKGAACGLAHLHECSPRKYVHGDIKPSNILLDTNFNPYIADFGLNRLISITGTNPTSSGGFIGSALPYSKPTSTDRSHSYWAPEARVMGSKPTQKWDVYSLGVVLLEMLTGKSPELSSSSPSTSATYDVLELVRWVRKGFEVENPLSGMVDPVLLQAVHAKKEVLAVFHIGLACTETDPELRPRMKTVLENLERIAGA